MIATMKNLRKSLVATVVIVLVSLFVTPSSGCEYAKYSPNHSLCISKKSTCPLTKSSVTGGDISMILKAHNMHRSLVTMGLEKRGKAPQPQAANMLEMTWDTELSAIAQKWTDQCKIQHDCLNCRRTDRFMTGQNIYVTFSTAEGDEPEWELAVKSWYNEVAEFNPSMIKPFVFNKPLGHYTQVLWATTDKIGCGYAAYKQGKFNYKLYICDYGPAGNIINKEMYIKGAPCTQCPDGSSCSNVYNGLCSFGSSGGKGVPKLMTPSRTSRSIPITTTTMTPAPTTRRVQTTTTTTTTTTRQPLTFRIFKTQTKNQGTWWKKPVTPETTPNTKINQIEVQARPVFSNKRVFPIQGVTRFNSKTITTKQNSATTKIAFANHPPFGNQGAQKQFGIISTTEKITGERILSGSPVIGNEQNSRQVIVPDNAGIEVEDLRRTFKAVPRTTPTRRVTSPRTRPTVVECNFDTKLCPISRIGAALWLLKVDSLQGKYYDSVLRAGESTQLFIMDGQGIPISKPSCFSFNYRKFPVIGETGISLNYSVHLFGKTALQGTIEFDTNTDWMQESMDLPAGINLSVASFKMALPPGNPSRAYHISLDDIVIEEGACPRK